MYGFSRAIYREIADEIIEDPQTADFNGNHERVLRACEAAMDRLATDRHYFARPARTLFRDIRAFFPMRSQLKGSLGSSSTTSRWADGSVAPASPRTVYDVKRKIRSSAGPARKRHAVPADAVASQGLLPLAPASGGHRGLPGSYRRIVFAPPTGDGGVPSHAPVPGPVAPPARGRVRS